MVSTSEILQICGYLEHNDGCQKAVITCMPDLHIHPLVYFIALGQLSNGTSVEDVQTKNQKLFKTRGYKDMPDNLELSPYCWLLLQTDFQALYRQYNCLVGVNIVEAPHINVYHWLDPMSHQYSQALANTVFHYSAQKMKDNQFEICIAMKDMQDAAWKYAHRSQIILNKTFGLCDKQILLFIVMGVDDERKGIPLVFLLFSAPSGNKQSSSGYNTDIIAKLLEKWWQMLGKDERSGEEFIPFVGLTDTDLKERAALLCVFSLI